MAAVGPTPIIVDGYEHCLVGGVVEEKPTYHGSAYNRKTFHPSVLSYEASDGVYDTFNNPVKNAMEIERITTETFKRSVKISRILAEKDMREINGLGRYCLLADDSKQKGQKILYINGNSNLRGITHIYFGTVSNGCFIPVTVERLSSGEIENQHLSQLYNQIGLPHAKKGCAIL